MSRSDRQVAITGVLMDPESLSCTVWVNRDATFQQIIIVLSERLSAKYNTLFDPKNPIVLEDLEFFIASNPLTSDCVLEPITSLSIPAPLDRTFTVLFKMPKSHAFRALVNENKENSSRMSADILVRDEELSELKAERKTSRGNKNKGGSVAYISATDSSSIQKALDDMRRDLREQSSLITEQASKLTEQASKLSEQTIKLSEQASKLTEQGDKINRLEASNAQTTATLNRQSTTLHALHRRVVLDEARDVLINRYGLAISDLRLGATGRKRGGALGELVRSVRSKLNAEDAALLPDDALKMIFDGGKNTVRQQGNVAAHNASKEELSLAVLGTGLNSSQLASLEMVYKFTHNEVPKLHPQEI
ncbi:hypothetical protein DEU56DRAFT_771882 [Suillus clintonianus]|uniref:uncharacterized protein n=1 Tax=Suillus clintonianus TaxID=1904413 RepID=UPI001B87FD8B|nr:uncharacterized protein DEU56DRAFT_771882 [Suillus clintonianus]KAG2153924.1 hypothetical protein DEU56DRAFT_771882 [Suillus clintonianus]